MSMYITISFYDASDPSHNAANLEMPEPHSAKLIEAEVYVDYSEDWKERLTEIPFEKPATGFEFNIIGQCDLPVDPETEEVPAALKDLCNEHFGGTSNATYKHRADLVDISKPNDPLTLRDHIDYIVDNITKRSDIAPEDISIHVVETRGNNGRYAATAKLDHNGQYVTGQPFKI